MLKNFYPAIIWIVIITFLSAAPGLPAMDWDFISVDKFGHFMAYSMLAWLICRGFFRTGRPVSTMNYLAAFCFSAGWGMLMEWMQGTFFPHRFFEWPDEVANAAGAVFGILHFMNRHKKKAQPIDNQ